MEMLRGLRRGEGQRHGRGGGRWSRGRRRRRRCGGRRGCSGRRRRERDGVSVGGGVDGRLGLLQQPLHGLAVGLAEPPREMEDPRSTLRGHQDPATPAVDLGVAVLVGAPLGRERLLPQLPGLRHHLQLLLRASMLLLLMLPGAAEDGRYADTEEQRRLDLGILQLRLLLLLRHLG